MKKIKTLWGVVDRLYNDDLSYGQRSYWIGFETDTGEYPGQADIFYTKKLALFRAKLLNDNEENMNNKSKNRFHVVPIKISEMV